jgi:hypothetical protein
VGSKPKRGTLEPPGSQPALPPRPWLFEREFEKFTGWNCSKSRGIWEGGAFCEGVDNLMGSDISWRTDRMVTATSGKSRLQFMLFGELSSHGVSPWGVMENGFDRIFHQKV